MTDCEIIGVLLLKIFVQTDTQSFYLPSSQMSTSATIFLMFTFLVLISSTAKGSLEVTNQEYPLIYYTKLISEHIFTPGLPLVVMLPQVGRDSTNKEFGYLIEELHISSRWPILVHKISYKMEGYTRMHTQTHPHGSYIIFISGPCKELNLNTLFFRVQLNELSFGKNSWNPKAKFIVSIMSNCTHTENTKFSKVLLTELWFREVMNAAVIFLMSNKHGGIYMQENTSDSAQGTYLELHTWYPYENSERCNPTEGTVPVKVFTVRHLSDIRRSDIFRGYNNKNFQGCPFKVFVRTMYPLVYPPKHVRYNDSYNQTVYEEGIEIEMLKLIGNALNMSLDIVGFRDDYSYQSAGNRRKIEALKGHQLIYVGWVPGVDPEFDNITEHTRSYLALRLVWYTPCAVKYQKWRRFFKIFSVDMWICFALSLASAAITVKCISYYARKSHMHESQSYSNISSVTANIIAVSMSVSVSKQPRSAPLRLFFLCWVCYSVAISTVFQAYLTTFLIEPGYEEPLKTVEQMLNSEKNFGFLRTFKVLFTDTSDPADSAIFKGAVECPDEPTCFIWAAIYRNISTILNDWNMGIYRSEKNLTDGNNRPLLCVLEDGAVRTFDLSILFIKRSPFFEFLNNVIIPIVEGGIVMHIKKRGLEKAKIQIEFNSPTSDDNYFVFGVIHMQTAFYLLMLGHVLAFACFLTEIMWHRYRSKRR